MDAPEFDDMPSAFRAKVEEVRASVRDDEGGRIIDSLVLMGKAGRVTIVHRGKRYLLRETSQGKLILTA